MQDELPKFVTISQAGEWLQARTSTPWALPHLLDAGLVPLFWLDYSPEAPDIFGDRFEGVLCRMLFEGDLQRLRALPTGDALATVYALPDGRIMRAVPGVPVPRDELVFNSADVHALADAFCQQQVQEAPQAAAPLVHRVRADLLTETIEQARRQATNPSDANQVFTILRDIAIAKRSPFFGCTEEGLQWIDAQDKPKILSLDALRKRLARNTASTR